MQYVWVYLKMSEDGDPWHRGWELNASHMQEQCIVLSTEPSIQPLIGALINISVASAFVITVAGTLLWRPWDVPESSDVRQQCLEVAVHPPVKTHWLVLGVLDGNGKRNALLHRPPWDSRLRSTSCLLWITSSRTWASAAFYLQLHHRGYLCKRLSSLYSSPSHLFCNFN